MKWILVRNNKRLSLPSSMPKIYAKLKLIMLKDSVNSEYFLEEFMVPGFSRLIKIMKRSHYR